MAMQKGSDGSITLSVLPEASGVMFAFSTCIYWFQAFSVKMFLLFGMPVAAFIKYFKHRKGLILFRFALLCFTAPPGMDIKFRVEFPSEFCIGRRQTRSTDETTLTRTVTVTGSPSGTEGPPQSPDMRGCPEGILH